MAPRKSAKGKRGKGGKGGKGGGGGAAEAAAAEVKSEVNPETGAAVTGQFRRGTTWRDICIDGFSITAYGQVLVQDTVLKLSAGRRYGLIARNGEGKSTLLNVIAQRQAAVPEHIDIYHLTREVEPSDTSALDCVLMVDDERNRINSIVDLIMERQEANSGELSDDDNTLLIECYERLDELDSDLAAVRATKLLLGLGFTQETIHQPAKDFSGGWRMRISLARALFLQPSFLLLDEPTNHLDMESVVWLEGYLRTWDPKGHRILLVVSHSQDFLNSVCTHMMHLHLKNLHYYGGNYDAYVRVRAEKELQQQRQHNFEQAKIAHMKSYIARFGHGSAKLARQAKSREKAMARMERSGLTSAVFAEKELAFVFEDPEDLPPPVLQVQKVSFHYPGTDKLLYKDLEFGIDLDTRVALVGPNGVGKSTLLNILGGELQPTKGMIRHHNKLVIGKYTQHFEQVLRFDETPLEFLIRDYKDRLKMEDTAFRSWLGRFGLTGAVQTNPISAMSDGQKARLVFAFISLQHPHILFLDEPTNALDIETIDALAMAINAFDGGVVLVSHDMRLISQVADQIWVCENQTVRAYEGGIVEYKQDLQERLVRAKLLDD